MDVTEHFYDRSISCLISKNREFLFAGTENKYFYNLNDKKRTDIQCNIRGNTLQSFSDDNKYLAVCTSYNCFYLIDVSSGNLLLKKSFSMNLERPVFVDGYVYLIEYTDFGFLIHSIAIDTCTVNLNIKELYCFNPQISDFYNENDELFISCDTSTNAGENQAKTHKVFKYNYKNDTTDIISEFSYKRDFFTVLRQRRNGCFIAWNGDSDKSEICILSDSGEIINSVTVNSGLSFGILCRNGKFLVVQRNNLYGISVIDTDTLEKKDFDYPRGTMNCMDNENFFSIECVPDVGLYEISD